jgi:toxin ParE1/3/4
MKVVWTDAAKRNLRTIHDYIAHNSPAYAQRMVDRLTSRSKKFGVFPLSGRVVPEFEVGQIREVFQRPTGSSIIFDLTTLM